MSYQFPSDIRERLDAFLQGGALRSDDDVIRRALDALADADSKKWRRWHERNQLAQDDFAEGRMEPLDREQFWREQNVLAQQQSAQGLSRPLDEERILARLRERLAKDGIVD